MKKFDFTIFALVLFPLLFFCCTREHVNVASSPVEVLVSIRGSQSTKVTDVVYSNESKVKSLQVFVFNGDELEAHRSVENSLSTLIPATSGERSVWAVTNAPDIFSVLQVSESNPMTLAKLKAHTSDLKDNAPDGFVMVGSVTQELVDGGNVQIEVKRLVSRVSIGKISASLKDYREGYSVRINSLFLVNVAGSVSLDLPAETALWYNRLTWSDNELDAILSDDLSDADPAIIVKNNRYQKDGEDVAEHLAYVQEKLLFGQYELADGVTMVEDNSYQKEHVFYPYPNGYGSDNASSDSYSELWNPRGTILVIDATMIEADGVTEHPGYYPIVLPHLERNKTYSIDEVRITRLPGDVPYKPIETGESQVTITVSDWELGLNLGTVNI